MTMDVSLSVYNVEFYLVKHYIFPCIRLMYLLTTIYQMSIRLVLGYSLKCSVILIMKSICLLFSLVLCGVIKCHGITKMTVKEKNSLTEEQCVRSAVQSIFGDEATLYLIFRNMNYEKLPFDVPNPRVLINVSDTVENEIINFANNFIIQVDGNMDMLRILTNLDESNGGMMLLKSRPGKFLIITKTQELPLMFRSLWNNAYPHCAILVYDNKEGLLPKLYTANQFEAGNNCGDNFTVFNETVCQNGMLKTTLMAKPITNYGGCLVTSFQMNITELVGKCVDVVEDVLRKSFNASVKRIHGGIPIENFQVYNGNIAFKISIVRSEAHSHLYSITFSTWKWVWILPIPEIVSPIKIYLLIFSVEVWIMVAIGFLLMCVMWLLIMTFSGTPVKFGRICNVLLDVFSMTIWGSVSNMSRVTALRCLLLCYIVYAIHVQTAYTSSLIRVLTVPQYENEIKDLEQLANSKFPIYLEDYSEYCIFYEENMRYEVYAKLKNKSILMHYFRSLEIIVKHNNASVLILKGLLEQWEMDNKILMNNNMLADPSTTTVLKHKFGTWSNHYILHTLNHIITGLFENGIFQKIEKDYQLMYNMHAVTFNQHIPERVVLTLGHLYGLFVIFGVCLCVSVIVFISEVIIGWQTVTVPRRGQIHSQGPNHRQRCRRI